MRWPSFSYVVLPVIIIVMVTIGVMVGYGFVNANLEEARSRAIERRTNENQLHLQSVFDSYAPVLWGSNGLLQVNSTDEATWRIFMQTYDIPRNFSGLEAIGVSIGNSPTDSTIAYVSPQTEATNKSVGVNMGQLSELDKIMDRAARSGKTVVSIPFPDLYTTKTDKGIKPKGAGFLMYAPFYDATMPVATEQERLAALRGFSLALYRGDIFFEHVFKNVDLTNTRIRAYLGEAKSANLLYDTGPKDGSNLRSVTQKISEFGQDFTLVYTYDIGAILPWTLTYFPQILLFGGLALGLLTALAAGYLLRSRYRHLTIEKERDVKFAQDELLSLASHQLRTPATGVKQYLGMVLQGFAGDLNEKQRTYLERAYASNNRQLAVINDILHMAKLETGRIVLSERQFDIAKMVRDVVDEQRDSAEKGGITLTLHAPSQGLIVGDSHMLRMVVENLVSNAIKYTGENGEVTVRLARRANRWMLAVKDTGVGIAKSDYPKLFKQFSRINNPRSEHVTGTGVGLYLAYHLTVLHGGSISVVSTKGKGSTFTVRLPRKL